MKKVILSFLFIVVLIISGCASTGNSKISGPDNVLSGDGLSVNFKIDDERIKQGILGYDLILDNEKGKEITLNTDNFKLGTDGVREIFTSESLDRFYDKILEGGEKKFGPTEYSYPGTLDLEDNVLDGALSEFEIWLDINYDYVTEFDVNVIINPNPKSREDYIKFSSSDINQLAPIQIRDIKIEPSRNNNYDIEFYFSDKNRRMSDEEVSIELEDIDFYIGTQNIGSCTPGYKNGQYIEEIETGRFILNEDLGELVAKCELDLEENSDEYNTKIRGSFSYNYKIKIIELINLPREN